ncbi:MAG TPA: hypothetical protein VIV60_26525, partial [Polyangiaceae bacterium]
MTETNEGHQDELAKSVSNAFTSRFRLRKGFVSIVVAFLGLLASATTAFVTWIIHKTELDVKRIESEATQRLATEKQKFEIRQQYMALALEKKDDDAKRLPVLRFLKKADDAALSTWADEELRIVNDELERLKKQLTTTNEQLAESTGTKFRAAAAACDSECGPQLERCKAKCSDANRGECYDKCRQHSEPCIRECHSRYR